MRKLKKTLKSTSFSQRSSQRQVRVPIKFNDHVVEKLSQKKNDTSFVGFVEDIRVSMGIDDVQIRENRFEMNEGTIESNSVARKVQTPPIIVNNKLDKEDNKPTFNATVVNNDGNEFVIFDEELVQKGSSKWRLTICGYFVGCNMSSNELNYHLRRMWSKFGIQDVKVNSNGNCFFKIRTEEGMNEFKNKWEEDRRKEKNDLDEVIQTENRDANSWMANELNEGDATVLN
ncbi:hypothetical protein Tco_0385732 [Tanacetum coccineum]